MPNTDCELIAELKAALITQRYSPVVTGNYCAYARGFLDYFARRSIPIAEVTEAQVTHYLRHAIAMFRKRHGRSPGLVSICKSVGLSQQRDQMRHRIRPDL